MKELSIFVDESGDFGSYSHYCPFYLVTLVIHEQDNDISEHVKNLNENLANLDTKVQAIHTAPLIRREEVYRYLEPSERLKIFNKFFHFTRKVGIKYANITVDKKHKSLMDINNSISKQLSSIVKENLEYFQKFDKIIIYYDNGQEQLANILVSVFSSWFHDKFEYRTVSPYEYKLFQVADFICTLSLIDHKKQVGKDLTVSEKIFFKSYRDLKQNYLRHIKKLEFKKY